MLKEIPKTKLEYIWLDGHNPQNLRSKIKIAESANLDEDNKEPFPEWSFDGSSTQQAKTINSDRILKPVKSIADPLRENAYLILCEVFNSEEEPHESNTRSKLRDINEHYEDYECLYGFEQEYVLINPNTGLPLGFPSSDPKDMQKEQGEFYCGVGYENIRGRQIAEEHLDACLKAGIKISGVNAEVMIGQWEYQIGPVKALDGSDQLWLSRWLLKRIAERHGIEVTFEPKPVKGNWNGSGLHTNFSNKYMRESGGLDLITKSLFKLSEKHGEHIQIYGVRNEERMTGKHETSDINRFSWGTSDRGKSVRIPISTAKDGKGYFEDRRPAANADPYLITAALMQTICYQDK